ncbi:MAG: hypothetical protein K2K57_12830 [Oscillospiraceae bacterium]|nr:hypothetical protein [Oscillospiraceae bacterium]
MSERIDEIMPISGKSYIDDYDNIAEILKHFLNYTMEELNSALPQSCKLYDFAIDIARKLGYMEFVSRTSIEGFRLSDLLCIMKYYERTFSDPGEILMSYMKDLRNNIVCLKDLPWAMLFMEISVKSLMDYFNKESGTNKYSSLYLNICSLSKECAGFEVTDTTTLRQLFDGTAGALYASWNPGCDKDEYLDKIENSCLLIKCIFINGIAAWHYDKFNFIGFLEKHDIESESSYIIKL